MTEDEFKAYLCGDACTWEQLAPYVTLEPCDCGGEYCPGWQVRGRPARAES